MDTFIAKRIWRNRQSGMSLIELVIAMTVLVVGMLALMTLVATSVGSNNRNKLDTTGTLIAQKVLDGIAAQPATLNTTFKMPDCNLPVATTWTIATAPGASVNLDPNTGNVDFTQPYAGIAANYKMLYVSCGVGGTQATYDVRWNIRALTTYTKLVTVSARQLGVNPNNINLRFFSPPITLRTIVGQ